MKCPKCESEFEAVTHEDITIDRCLGCQGLLVTPDMLLEMRRNILSEKFLDTGSFAIGKQHDRIDDIDCPVCQVPMDKIEDPVQIHIWMERCPQCERIFLDAGEFSDLKYETFRDQFKALSKGPRPK